MKIWSQNFSAGGRIPYRYAFCEPDLLNPVRFAPNHNPHLAWSDVPKQAHSLALVCVDPDAPASPELVNRKDTFIPEDFPRGNFYHWSIINLPAVSGTLNEGAYSSKVAERGKRPAISIFNTGREGINDYTAWFMEDQAMQGSYGGYDGPCPPWNDNRIHRYQFRLFALDIPEVKLPESFNGHDVVTAIQGHVIDEATWEGTYTLNPKLL